VARRNAAVMIYDDAFTLIPSRAASICERLIAKGSRLPLGCETRGDCVTPELLRLMKAAGIVNIAFGLESAVPKILRAIGKVRSPVSADDPDFSSEHLYLDRVRTAVRSASSLGLNVTVSVMGGLPSETPADFQTTIDFVKALDVPFYAHNILQLYPGTPLYENRHQFCLDAWRDPNDGVWRTEHAYDTSRVAPLEHSTVWKWKWASAERVARVLGGRPSLVHAPPSSVWAVVIRGAEPSPLLGQWLRNILSINGNVVVFLPKRADHVRWSRLFLEFRVPCAKPIWLEPISGSLERFEVLGTIGDHTVSIVHDVSTETAHSPVTVDAVGNCDIPLWIGSDAGARCLADVADTDPSVAVGVQIADSCRVGVSPPRCKTPTVLHVMPDGAVRGCWYGCSVAAVGDSTGALERRRDEMDQGDNRSLPSQGARFCPITADPPPAVVSLEALDAIDLASQLTWFLQPGRYAVIGTARSA
jgi:hypothetical protein